MTDEGILRLDARLERMEAKIDRLEVNASAAIQRSIGVEAELKTELAAIRDRVGAMEKREAWRDRTVVGLVVSILVALLVETFK